MCVVFLAGRFSFLFVSWLWTATVFSFLSCLSIRCLVDNLHWGLLEDTYKVLSVDFFVIFCHSCVLSGWYTLCVVDTG